MIILAIAFFWLLIVGVCLTTPTHLKTTNHQNGGNNVYTQH